MTIKIYVVLFPQFAGKVKNRVRDFDPLIHMLHLICI